MQHMADSDVDICLDGKWIGFLRMEVRKNEKSMFDQWLFTYPDYQ